MNETIIAMAVYEEFQVDTISLTAGPTFSTIGRSLVTSKPPPTRRNRFGILALHSRLSDQREAHPAVLINDQQAF